MERFGRSHTHSKRPSCPPSSSTQTPFRLDEGFSEDTSSQEENGRNGFAATAAQFQEWVMAQNEDTRADIAYEVLRTLRTSKIAAVVDRLTPLLYMDPLEKLPPEITSEIFSHLDAHTLVTASLASRTWRARVMDSKLWQDLYKGQGWGLNMAEIRQFDNIHASGGRAVYKKGYRGQPFGQRQPKKRATSGWMDSRGRKMSADVAQWREQHSVIEADTDMQSDSDDQEMQDAPSPAHHSLLRPNKRQSQDSSDEMDYSSSELTDGQDKRRRQPVHTRDPPFKSRLAIPDSHGGERLNWHHLYKQRQKLEQNWIKGRYTTFQLPHPFYPSEAHRECVYTIQFFGKWLVSGSRDKTLRVWDLDTRRLRGKPLVGHSQSVLCLQFDPTPDEDIIISGSSDSSVIIWRFSTGKKIYEIPSAHEESVLNLRFDSRYLITCSKDRRIKIWNRRPLVATDRDYPKISRNSTARVPTYIVDTSDIEPSLLEARMANGTVRALKPYMLLLTLVGHSAAVNAIQINGDLIVSASGDRLIKVWSTRDGRVLKTLQGHQKGIACVQFDSKRIVSGSSDNTVRIYDPYSSAEVAELKGHTNLVRTVQAGFGDMPGAEEVYDYEAREAERKYLEDLDSGLIVENRKYNRDVRNGDYGSSRLALGAKLPPGGGGSKWGRIVSGSYDESIIIWRKNAGGDWYIGHVLRHEPVTREMAGRARQRPNQQAAAQNVSQPASNHPVTASVAQAGQAGQANLNATSHGPAGAAHPAIMSASQIVQQTVGTSIASLGAGISNVMGINRVLNAPGNAPNNPSNLTTQNFTSSLTAAGGSQALTQAVVAHTQAAVNQAVQQALAQAGGQQARAQSASQQPHHQHQAAGPGVSNTNNHQAHTHTHAHNHAHAHAHAHTLPQHQQNALPPHNSQAHPQGQGVQQQQQQPQQQHQQAGHTQGQQPQPHTPGSRVFKLQFDTRRIVSCSQDSRIVGWDFANGDAEIIEASRFFSGP
ncbi:hypothetical protein A1O3_06026 [Capronia epimyces CBS 606.96]|uniref:Probable E3 ubiquitin ligase complex SCF subunit sconB n=1 Tax=Capronia epimyces CBS 606.96 TaxID=1182542 RepID=W9XPR2_9EURO|nr:uncharacterized protein A1O3_06026 [Capronia epimyces CBS 606.96]EXJ82213.1 hypothetical protein A1O3_06026 [Capronia epimyces CBS 606.96]